MYNLKFKILSSLVLLLVTGYWLLTPYSVSAHAVVKPTTAGIGSYTDFTVGVPSEKDAATISVKLLIPEGINSVTPIVKPGWNVQVINSAKTGEPDDDGNLSPIPEALLWTGGSVPAHQKDFFMFSTQVPAKETELDWKIEQTYSDGSVIFWNLAAGEQPKNEKGEPDFSKSGPYSKTMVVNDLAANTKPATEAINASTDSGNLPLILSVLAVILSGLSLGITFRKK